MRGTTYVRIETTSFQVHLQSQFSPLSVRCLDPVTQGTFRPRHLHLKSEARTDPCLLQASFLERVEWHLLLLSSDNIENDCESFSHSYYCRINIVF